MSDVEVCGHVSKDERARKRLVEIALHTAASAACNDPVHGTCQCTEFGIGGTDPWVARTRAGMRNPSTGHWCAAGLSAAMEDAGLVVPAPGTSARRGAVALLDFVAARRDLSALYSGKAVHALPPWIAPGDIIAWLQHPPPDPKGWRRGHVAVIVAVDEESITTVGWNEGKAPGRVEQRRLWRDPERTEVRRLALNRYEKRRVPRSSTVLWRRPGGLYGIARPVAA